MNKIPFLALASLFLLHSGLVPTHARADGNETRGTEDMVAIGNEIKAQMSAADRAQFEQRKEDIAFGLRGEVIRRLRALVAQVPREKLARLLAAPYAGMIARGLDHDLATTEIRLSSRCMDGTEDRTAVTGTVPGSPICVNVDRLAVLELVPVLNQDVPRGGLVYGVIFHEFARHYGLDDDHALLRAFSREIGRHLLVDRSRCAAGANICPLLGEIQGAARSKEAHAWKVSESHDDGGPLLAIDQGVSSRLSIKIEATGEGLTEPHNMRKCLRELERSIGQAKDRVTSMKVDDDSLSIAVEVDLANAMKAETRWYWETSEKAASFFGVRISEPGYAVYMSPTGAGGFCAKVDYRTKAWDHAGNLIWSSDTHRQDQDSLLFVPRSIR